MLTALSYQEILLRLLLATAIGLIFGLEREHNHKPAGVRTHILVCLAACVIALVSAYGLNSISEYYPSRITINIDPARLVVGVLTGIGFLGAGIIWKSPAGSIQGITTAAEIFLLAALGIACGLGEYFIALIAAAIGIITMGINGMTAFICKKITHIKNRKNKKISACTDIEESEDQTDPSTVQKDE